MKEDNLKQACAPFAGKAQALRKLRRLEESKDILLALVKEDAQNKPLRKELEETVAELKVWRADQKEREREMFGNKFA